MKTTRQVLVLLGHPAPQSLCRSLAESYAEGARQSGATVTILDLAALDFDRLADPRTVKTLEPDIQRAQDLIREAAHVAVVYPVWWGSAPAALKSFVDRAMTSGFAFNYGENGLPVKLLKGRTARILLTMDSPSFWHRFVYRGSAITWLRWATLWFSGFKVLRTREFCRVRTATPDRISAWLENAKALGSRDAG
ncbi:MAG: NAD(P)H-dependent oxidoreductase [Armatimonadetes bacterium]|nr:NAD(P)H-dependent oxidoreductase [Armatimonadota bacterium]